MNNNKDGANVGDDVLAGVLLLGSWRWTARVIGLVTTIVLARLLLPEDFGIAATGLLVVAFFEILIELGTDNYLIRLPKPQREDYDTAWTLRLLVIVAASLLIFLTAVPLAGYFGDDRLISVLQVLALASVLRGFTNIGLTMYRRDLKYGKIALVGLGQRLVGSITTLVFALLLQSYWAIVFGEIAFRITEVLFSYLIHSYRPQVCFTRFAKQWDFSKWIVTRNLAKFLQRRSDHVVVAKFYGIEQIGFYAMAMRFSALPTQELVAPMLQPIYSGLAKKQDNPADFARNVLQVFGASFAVVLPAATLFFTLSELLVISILGPNWQPSAPLVAPLVFAITATVLSQPAITTLTLLGHVGKLAAMHWLSAISMIGTMLIAAQYVNLEQLTVVRAVLGVAPLLLYFVWIRTTLTLPWRRLLASIYRPCIASLIMGVVTTWIAATRYGPWARIVLAALAGGLTYLISLYGLWRATGSQDAGEALLTRKFSKLFKRMTS